MQLSSKPSYHYHLTLIYSLFYLFNTFTHSIQQYYIFVVMNKNKKKPVQQLINQSQQSLIETQRLQTKQKQRQNDNIQIKMPHKKKCQDPKLKQHNKQKTIKQKRPNLTTQQPQPSLPIKTLPSVDQRQQKDKKKQTRQLPPSKETAFFLPRQIFPAVMIRHHYKRKINSIDIIEEGYYQCSACGYTVVRFIKHFCTMSNATPKFRHTYRGKYKQHQGARQINQQQDFQKIEPIKMKKLIQILLHNDGTHLNNEQRQVIMNQYDEWLIKGREENIKSNIRKIINQNNSKIVQVSPIQQQKLALVQMIQVDNEYDKRLNSIKKKKKQFQDIKNEMERDQLAQQKKRQQREQTVNKIFLKCLHYIEAHIKAQIYRSMQQKTKLKMQQQAIIISNITNQIQKFNLPQPQFDWSQKLDNYVVKKQIKGGSKYQKDILKVIEILKGIPYFYLSSISLLTTFFLNHKIYVRNYGNAILKQIKKIHNMNIPDISHNIKRSVKKRIKITITLNQIKQTVSELIREGKYTLATDLWYCLCLGLRINDIKRIYLIGDSGKFFDFIILVQIKNGHHAIRCIPSSLKKLIYWFGITYPITTQRLQILIDFCIYRFGSFYNLRHTLLTQTIAGIMKSSNFSPHASSKTTMRYYLDYTNYKLMDEIFHLQIINKQLNLINWTSNKKGIFTINKQKADEKQYDSILESEIYLPDRLSQRIDEQIIQDSFDKQLLHRPQLKQINSISGNFKKCMTSKQGLVFNISEELFNHIINIYHNTYGSIFKLISSATDSKIVVVSNSAAGTFQPDQSQYYNECLRCTKKQSEYIEDVNKKEFERGKILRKQRNKPIYKQSSQQQQSDKNQVKQKQPKKKKSNKSNINKTPNQNNNNQDSENQNKLQNIILPKDYQAGSKDRQVNTLLKYKKSFQQQIQQYPFLTGSTKRSLDFQHDDLIVVVQQNKMQNKTQSVFSFTTLKSHYFQVQEQIIKQRIKDMPKKQKANLQLTIQGVCQNCKQPIDIEYCIICPSRQYHAICKCLTNKQCRCTPKRHIPIQDRFACAKGINHPYGPHNLTGIVEPQLINQPNNIKQTVISSGRIFLQQMGSSTSISQRLFIPIDIATKDLIKIIKNVRKNQHLLPLKIQQIINRKTKKTKGFGVRALNDIAKNTVIGTYLGIVKPHEQAQVQDDSKFSLGWYDRTEYFITCYEGSNIGRYFNCSTKSSTANMQIYNMILDIDDICPFFVTTRNVKKGEQLTWDYGPLYPKVWL